VLSIGLQQLKQDMRYRVKLANVNKPKSGSLTSTAFDEPLAFGDDEQEAGRIGGTSNDLVRRSGDLTAADFIPINETDFVLAAKTTTTTTSTVEPQNDYLIQNWQFEIRKLTYDDAGTYQCLLGLVKPIAKNITLQVIRMLKSFNKQTN
jgi:hypothetical protein